MIASIALALRTSYELRKDARDCGFNWWRRYDSTTGFAPALGAWAADFFPRDASAVDLSGIDTSTGANS